MSYLANHYLRFKNVSAGYYESNNVSLIVEPYNEIPYNDITITGRIYAKNSSKISMSLTRVCDEYNGHEEYETTLLKEFSGTKTHIFNIVLSKHFNIIPSEFIISLATEDKSQIAITQSRCTISKNKLLNKKVSIQKLMAECPIYIYDEFDEFDIDALTEVYPNHKIKEPKQTIIDEIKGQFLDEPKQIIDGIYGLNYTLGDRLLDIKEEPKEEPKQTKQITDMYGINYTIGDRPLDI